MVEQFLKSLKKKHIPTYEHAQIVGALMHRFAEVLNFTKDKIKQMRTAGQLHEVGKLNVPDVVFKKIDEKKNLSEEEKKQFELASRQIEKVLDLKKFSKDVTLGLVHRHERFDGHGVPDGLKGDKIPRVARMLYICDVYAALITPSYPKDSYPRDTAIAMLRDQAGKSLDPDLLEIFVEKVLEEDNIKKKS